MNSVLEENLRFQTDYSKITFDVTRAERERFINAKYKDHRFMKTPEQDEKTRAKEFISCIRKASPMEILTRILQGVDVNMRDKDGYTPLHKAVKNKRPLITQLLISNGAEVDAKGGEEEETPLHIAARNQDGECIATLVSSGSANISLQNAEGKYPIDICEAIGPMSPELQKSFEGFDPSAHEVRLGFFKRHKLIPFSPHHRASVLLQIYPVLSKRSLKRMKTLERNQMVTRRRTHPRQASLRVRGPR